MAAGQFTLLRQTRLPELFCFSVVQAKTDDSDRTAVGISNGLLPDCDAFRVYSNVSFISDISTLARCNGCVEAAINGSMAVNSGGPYNNLLNTPIFHQVWTHIFRSGIFRQYDWTVKLDSDCAFSPDRLRHYLALFPTTATIGGNYYNSDTGYYNDVMGPMEVVSQKGMLEFEENLPRCLGSWSTAGEDLFLQLCAGRIGMPVTPMPLLLLNNPTGSLDTSMTAEPPAPSCTHDCHIGFHPFKNTAGVHQCVQNMSLYNVSYVDTRTCTICSSTESGTCETLVYDAGNGPSFRMPAWGITLLAVAGGCALAALLWWWVMCRDSKRPKKANERTLLASKGAS